jgi:FAD/FMN-containing dehydrogenase
LNGECDYNGTFGLGALSALAFAGRLDEIVVRHGGRVYLAKDARMRAEIFRAVYPRFSDWSVIRNGVDPQNRFDSDLARRLEMTVSLAGTAA